MLELIAFALLIAGQPGPQSSPAAAEGERAADTQEKMICKRFVETGSLVRAQRVCKTKRDWERNRDSLRSSSGPGSASCRDAANGGSGCAF